jgi:microcystin degradation protein MlrC
MRVGIIGLLQETNTFISRPTTLREFEEHMLLTGPAIRDQLAETAHEIGGFFEGLDRAGIEAAPMFVTRALPFGMVTAETYAVLRERMLQELRRTGPVDGLLVAPHGATVSEGVHDVDGDWLTRVREAVGSRVPIVSTADPHANLSPQMIAAVDAMIAYRTNPHVDQRQRGIEAAELMVRTLRGEVRPTVAGAFPPTVINIDRQCTHEEPCRSLCARLDAVRRRPGVLSASLFLGFPYADVAEMGSAVAVVTGNNRPLAESLAVELAMELWERREQFTARLVDPAAAVEQASKLPGPVCLLDMGDNVGGGSAADGTVLAHEFHRRSLGPAFVCLYDPEAVRRAEAAGIGSRLTLSVGGKTDRLHGEPLQAEFRVVRVSDGRFEEPEARHGGLRHFDQGRTAVVATDQGLTVMLTSRRMVPFSLHQLTDFGIDPARFQYLVAKGVNAPLAAYEKVCRSILRVNTPGVTTADLRQLTYAHRRRPMYPFEPDAAWVPRAGELGERRG